MATTTTTTTTKPLDTEKASFSRDERPGVRDLCNERCRHVFDFLDGPVEHSRLADIAQAILKRARMQRERDEAVAIRAAFSMPEGVATLAGLVNAMILQGVGTVRDTTAGWTHRTELPNYLPAKMAVVEDVPRLSEIPRGGVARATRFSISTAENYRLARFGLQFVLDEQDMLSLQTVGVQMLALSEIGKAAMRLIPDSVYAELLSNPTMESGTAVFHADHSNLDTAALDSTALTTAIGEVENQYLEDSDGAPAHINQSARYLVVPPGLKVTARELGRSIALGDADDLVVRSEPRLSATGVRDPKGNTIRTGSATNWLLCADAEQRPSVIVATLEGRKTPLVRSFKLERGQWGIGFDIQFAVGVSIPDYRGLYYSDGTV